MENLVDKIVEIDKIASEKVKTAEKEKASALLDIDRRKQDIIDEINKIAVKKLENFEKSEKESAEEEIKCHDESGIIALSQSILNENEFQVVILHTVNELKFQEIAKIIGGNESTIRWQYNNAIAKVKKEYERRSTS